jgi:hypothetical protein
VGGYCKSCSVERPQSDTPLLEPTANRALSSSTRAPRLVTVSDLGVPADDDNEAEGK